MTGKMERERRLYSVYVLRSWVERHASSGEAVRRFSLEDPRTGERRGFADLDALLAFLATQAWDERWTSGNDDEQEA